jgi:phage host-nuclease inhibitor protein Gam
MAREKKVVHTSVSVEKMEEAFGEYAKADARMQKINATMDVEFTKIRDKYSEELNKLSQIKEQNFDIMQAFAMENKDELFGKKKSIESVHGVIGFRVGTPKLKTLKGFTWGAVTNLLKEFLPAYVRITEEPAKDKLLADRDNDEVSAFFPKVGISVVQDESFFVEPKKEAI